MRGSACIAWMVREATKAATPRQPTSRKLGEAGIAEVMRRLEAGETQVSIAKALGVSQSLIWHTKTYYAKTRM